MDFHAVLVEGVFDKDEGSFRILPSPIASFKNVYDELHPLIGFRVRIAMHHLPPNLAALDDSRWGGGSCLWQPSPCPAGHHVRPGYLLNVTGEGVLRHEDGVWFLDQLDGSEFPLPFDQMVGHYGRIAAATLLDVDKLRDSLSLDDLAAVEGLSDKIESVKDLLARLGRGI